MISEKEIMNLYKKYEVPENIQNHCEQVAKTALILAQKVSQKVDIQKLKVACMFHDIGRVNFLHERGNYEFGDNRHEKYSADILRKEGLEEIAKIVAKHGYFLIDYNFNEFSIEEKLLVTADLITTHEGEINIKKRKQQVLSKYKINKDYKAFERFKKAYELIEPFVKELGY